MNLNPNQICAASQRHNRSLDEAGSVNQQREQEVKKESLSLTILREKGQKKTDYTTEKEREREKLHYLEKKPWTRGEDPVENSDQRPKINKKA